MQTWSFGLSYVVAAVTTVKSIREPATESPFVALSIVEIWSVAANEIWTVAARRDRLDARELGRVGARFVGAAPAIRSAGFRPSSRIDPEDGARGARRDGEPLALGRAPAPTKGLDGSFAHGEVRARGDPKKVVEQRPFRNGAEATVDDVAERSPRLLESMF
jgi:hypothetical protein